jgi:hypothetical protein
MDASDNLNLKTELEELRLTQTLRPSIQMRTRRLPNLEALKLSCSSKDTTKLMTSASSDVNNTKMAIGESSQASPMNSHSPTSKGLLDCTKGNELKFSTVEGIEKQGKHSTQEERLAHSMSGLMELERETRCKFILH